MFLFVGDKPSATAARNGWTWESGRLAAKQLFEALDAAGVPRSECRFANWFVDGGAREVLTLASGEPRPLVIALGCKVSRALNRAHVFHTLMVHPAARGAIRLKANYAAHVADVIRRARRLAA